MFEASQEKIMRARYSLQFMDRDTAKIGHAAARLAIKPGPAETISISKENDLFYNPGWVDMTDEATIAKDIAALVDKHTPPEIRAHIDQQFETK